MSSASWDECQCVARQALRYMRLVGAVPRSWGRRHRGEHEGEPNDPRRFVAFEVEVSLQFAQPEYVAELCANAVPVETEKILSDVMKAVLPMLEKPYVVLTRERFDELVVALKKG